MRKYWIKHGNFANIYDLAYTEDADGEAVCRKYGWERIKKADAIHYCRKEKERAELDSSFSGYAADTIRPFGVNSTAIWNDHRYILKGYIWERA